MPTESRWLPAQRVFIVGFGVVPTLIIALVHPRSTLTLSLSDANGALGSIAVVVGVLVSVIIEAQALRRLQGVLVFPLLAAAVLTSISYPGTDTERCREDTHCDWHRGFVYTLCGIEIVLAWTRGYGVLALSPYAVMGVVGLIYTEAVSTDAPVVVVVELIAALWTRALAACAARYEGARLRDGVLQRPRELVQSCLGDKSYDDLAIDMVVDMSP